MATLGYSSLVFALFAEIYGVAALMIGSVRKSKKWLSSGRQACLILFPLLSISVIALLIPLIRKDYRFEYVFETVNNAQPFYLRIAALWGKQSGSLLFWTWLFSIFLFVWTLKSVKTDDPLFPTAAILLLLNIGFFNVLNLFGSNPFNRFWLNNLNRKVYTAFSQISGTVSYQPADGMGMNPLLRHFGMVLHPPALYLGFIGVFIPAAYELSALIHKPDHFDWIQKTHSWFLFAWIFLAIGLILGSRWAYDVLGWGGYWGWDPVEVSALIPFLLLTAYIHAMIGFRKTGRYKAWVAISGLLTALSIVFSTFVTRSGLIASVHAFSASPLSQYLILYLAVSLITVVVILLIARKNFASQTVLRKLSFEQTIQTREFFITAMIVVLFVIAAFCLWGILVPNISALFSEKTISIGADYYTSATGPLFLILVFLTGCFPLTSWGVPFTQKIRKIFFLLLALSAVVTGWICINLAVTQPLRIISIWVLVFSISVYLFDWIDHAFVINKDHRQFSFVRLFSQFSFRRPRLSTCLIHGSILLMAVGIIGIEFFQKETQFTFKPNDTRSFSGFELTFNRVTKEDTLEGYLTTAEFDISQNGKNITTVYPKQKYYETSQQMTTIPGIKSDLKDDLYLILTDSEASAEKQQVAVTIFYNPLINWLWIGGILLCLGGILAYATSLRKEKTSS